MQALWRSQEELMEQIATRVMDEYVPPTHPTAARVRTALPTLCVRAADATGEPGHSEALVCAGEPCAVCHDEFCEGGKVVELPCSHVSRGKGGRAGLKSNHSYLSCIFVLKRLLVRSLLF